MIEITSTITLSPFVKSNHSIPMELTNISNFVFSIDQGKNRNVPLLLILRDSQGHIRIQYQTPIINEKLVVAKDAKFCSAGCVAGEIPCGDWELEIVYTPHSADKVPKFTGRKVDYKVTITFNEKLEQEYDRKQFCQNNVFIDDYNFGNLVNEEYRWYKGDFHVHTNLSDGNMDDFLAMSVCKKQELDFLYATEHNIITPSYQKGDTLVIPSMELTTPYGHFNVFGMKEYVEFIKYFNESFDAKAFNNLLSILKEKGYLISVNHPFMRPWTNQINIQLEHIHTMEIMCDPTFKVSKPSTLEALKFFDQLWLNGHKIWGIGGSDSHLLPTETFPGSKDPSIYGDPGTYVFCNGLSIKNLNDAIQKGRIYFSRFRKLQIDIQNEGKTIFVGDEVKGNINYHILTDKPCEWRLILDGKVIDRQFGGEVNFDLELNEGSYARVEGWEDDELVAFINPIHNSLSGKKSKTWYETLGGFKDEERNHF